MYSSSVSPVVQCIADWPLNTYGAHYPCWQTIDLVLRRHDFGITDLTQFFVEVGPIRLPPNQCAGYSLWAPEISNYYHDDSRNKSDTLDAETARAFMLILGWRH